ncbi:MAG: 2-oxoglutarate ferredoxin oxidoreductase subunit gamma, partial [Bacteroidales bacterium]|nr:2-oxoglutarate ferredoxin oxidoreductase subunit gamma [Bacteroidales bacterium]
MELNAAKSFNMFILGGFLKLCPIVDLEHVMLGLKKSLPERHHNLLPQNEEAIKKGMDIIEEVK